MLTKLGYDKDVIERVSYLVAHHHLSLIHIYQVLKAEEIIRTKALIRADLTLLNRSLHKVVNQTLVMILIWAIRCV